MTKSTMWMIQEVDGRHEHILHGLEFKYRDKYYSHQLLKQSGHNEEWLIHLAYTVNTLTCSMNSK